MSVLQESQIKAYCSFPACLLPDRLTGSIRVALWQRIRWLYFLRSSGSEKEILMSIFNWQSAIARYP